MQIRLLLGLMPARTGARFINTASLRSVLAGGECVIKFNLFHISLAFPRNAHKKRRNPN